MSWRGRDFRVSLTLRPFFESKTSMIPDIEITHFCFISSIVSKPFTVCSNFPNADFIMSKTTLMSPLDWEILRQSKSKALSSIILKKTSLTACLRGLVLSGEMEITHFWNKEFYFSCTIDWMSSNEYGWNNSIESLCPIAEFFFRNGRSTLFAIPTTLAFVFSFLFPPFKIWVINVLKAFSFDWKQSTSSITITQWHISCLEILSRSLSIF